MNITRSILFFVFAILLQPTLLSAQKKEFTHADTLRGSLRTERTCYDVTYYQLSLRIDTGKRMISGSNKIFFKGVEASRWIQLDLFDNMGIDKIVQGITTLKYKRDGNALFVELEQKIKPGDSYLVEVFYHGKPQEAKRAPWDGGFSWARTPADKFWLGVSCQGLGASVWWPCKEYLGDEPDSMRIIVDVPKGLTCVSNGVMTEFLRTTDPYDRFVWRVGYPINNYNVTLNVAEYAHLEDEYDAQDESLLHIHYYVLPENAAKAKAHFAQVKPMLHCYEKYLGKYPFWEDGYKLVETPYLGMEHQSAIAYGNQYKTGYAGRDYSKIGLNFDYIIIHETGHEWWGNSVSCKDIADMWIHEGFCTYTECIYVECMHGYDTAQLYVNAKRRSVDNKVPMQGPYGVNEEGDGDMYDKGALFLNTLRSITNNDALWWRTIKNMADTTFKMRNTDYAEVVAFFNQKIGRDLSAVFAQYVQHAAIPELQYKLEKKSEGNFLLSYRWQTDVKDFRMPFVYTIGVAKNQQRLEATNDWQMLPLLLPDEEALRINDKLMLIDVKRMY